MFSIRLLVFIINSYWATERVSFWQALKGAIYWAISHDYSRSPYTACSSPGPPHQPVSEAELIGLCCSIPTPLGFILGFRGKSLRMREF